MCEKYTFEIWCNNEILVDNLSFADAAEQIVIYKDFFDIDAFIVRRNVITNHTCPDIKFGYRKYLKEWIEYADYLQSIGNLL